MANPILGKRGFIDYAGQEMANSVVIGIAGRNKYGTVVWKLRCAHGIEWEAISGNLKRKKTCPCLLKEWASNVQKKHGHTWQSEKGSEATPEYAAWQSMKDRCSNPNNQFWHCYGGNPVRPVRVCQRWLDSFDDFFADMGPRPGTGYSLDRFPDMHGDYEPGNCRWATQKQQRNNSSQNKFIQFRGKTATVKQHIEELGITGSIGYIYSRLRDGWIIEDALCLPRGSSRPS